VLSGCRGLEYFWPWSEVVENRRVVEVSTRPLPVGVGRPVPTPITWPSSLSWKATTESTVCWVVVREKHYLFVHWKNTAYNIDSPLNAHVGRGCGRGCPSRNAGDGEGSEMKICVCAVLLHRWNNIKQTTIPSPWPRRDWFPLPLCSIPSSKRRSLQTAPTILARWLLGSQELQNRIS
jgi:hypothetical protein